MISFPFQIQASWSALLITGGFVIVASEVVYYVYHSYFSKSKRTRERRIKRKTLPPWALRKARDLEPPLVTPEKLKDLNERRPPEVWNTVLLFPDPMPHSEGSSFRKLVNYLREATISIFICMFLCSNRDLTEVILRRAREGVMVLVITDYETSRANKNGGVAKWKSNGIQVRMRKTGYYMHNKFCIIDNEAVLTGSLNWTGQGVRRNYEDVMVSTDTRIVPKFVEEFNKLWIEMQIYE